MLKIRVMPTLLYRSPTLVKGERFDSWRRVGTVMQAVKVYNLREVDELIFLDIAATAEGRGPDVGLVDEFADECFMPLTIGGGVRSVDDFDRLLRAGADKIAINTAAVEVPALIAQAAQRFGSQCVVVSIDAVRHADGRYEVMIHSGRQGTGRDPIDLARTAESLGAGEILLTSVDRDGTMSGYDLDLIGMVSRSVGIPVIASGGAGDYDDFYRAITVANASGVAAASIFHFTQQTPREAKRYLAQRGIPVRGGQGGR